MYKKKYGDRPISAPHVRVRVQTRAAVTLRYLYKSGTFVKEKIAGRLRKARRAGVSLASFSNETRQQGGGGGDIQAKNSSLQPPTPHITPPVLSTCSFHTNSGCGKERRMFIDPDGDLPRQHPFGTTVRFSGPVPADSRDPMNSGLTRWRMVV